MDSVPEAETRGATVPGARPRSRSGNPPLRFQGTAIMAAEAAANIA